MTRGSGRGRGRGQNINAERETAMNNPVNFANTLENMVAAMQATAETIGQQVNNGDMSNGENRLMTLATFLKINLPTFRGTTNPTEADNWFQATEWALQVQQVPEDQCVEFATYQLMGEALGNECSAFILLIASVSDDEQSLNQISVVNEFPEVFPEDIPKFSPSQEIEFAIELVPRVGPISIAPY
ncbi:uncharacterized protein LOC127741209 [Arachis duranensis]|uniref:Uncharacterized protein LOC127741209 n=1 Tax=Arachis duranensis TaxID=130453 RepID=A0A9C6WBP4_ARADU|nr:uncharacterized protein LOC127741209 [Arachis duranensis]